MSSLFNNFKKNYSENVSTPKVGVLNVNFALRPQTQDLQIFKKFNMSQMNPTETGNEIKQFKEKKTDILFILEIVHF